MTSKDNFKDITLEQLAHMVASGFAQTATKEELTKAVEKIDARFDKVDERFEKLDARVDGLSNQMDYVTDKVQITHNLMENDLLRRLAKLEKVVLHR